jgi:phenylalanyl-tRNA synthetase beta chain
MKVSLNWLSDYVNVSMPVAELAALFTRIGLNCEEIIDAETDLVLDLEVTSNRSDCLGHIGVARELAAALDVELSTPEIGELPTAGRADELTAVEVHAPELCPRYTARVLRGVTVGPSPSWLVERLEAVGLRSVNNVVDVTNYVLMEYSQPLHSFDYDKLAEHRIVVRRAKGGETMVSIDETTCKLDAGMLVIADADRPVAIAGVMGGLDTEVGEQTTNVLIESAQFDPLTTRRTSRTLQLMSESNYRFERGIDPVKLDEASLRACQLIIQLAGGELAEGMVDVWAQPYQPPTVSLRPRRTEALLGIEVPVEQQETILRRLGLSPERRQDELACTIPPHRADLTREVDLIEEVGRMVGFDQIPVHHDVTHEVVSEALPERIRRVVGDTLTAAGFDEAMTFSFIDDDEAGPFGHAETVRVDANVRKTNNALRPTILPSLLRACKTNQDAGTAEVNLFELSAVFPAAGGGVIGDQHVELALVTTRELRDLRGAVEVLFETVCPNRTAAVVPASVAGLAEGVGAEIELDGEKVGAIGMVDAAVQDRYDLDRPIAAAWVRLDVLERSAELTRMYVPLAKFPAIERDLSLVVDESVTWQQLADAVASVDQPQREKIDYVTTYRGKPLAKGKKSVTMNLTYRSPEGTLRREQVDEQVSEVVSAAAQRLSAELRS